MPDVRRRRPLIIRDPHLVKSLNLVRTSPAWVLRERPDGSASVLKPRAVPRNDGLYWVAGVTITACGTEIESVFVLDTDSGAEQSQVFWFHGGSYYGHNESAQVAALLGIDHDRFFPYSCRYHVPVEGDIHT